MLKSGILDIESNIFIAFDQYGNILLLNYPEMTFQEIIYGTGYKINQSILDKKQNILITAGEENVSINFWNYFNFIIDDFKNVYLEQFGV